MIDGLDVSHHQATTPPLAGYDFLIARAAYGTDPDDRFRQHVAAARRRGLVTGAYLFLLPSSIAPIRDQVAALLAAIAGAGGVDLVAIDQEREAAHPAPTNAETRQAIELVESTGRPCGLYHSTSGYPRDANGASWRWVADYRPLAEPPVPWDVWQWTSTAGGLHLDRNRFAGTRAELVALGRKDDPMAQSFTYQPTARAGTLTVAGEGHWYLSLADGRLHGPIDPDTFGTMRAFGPVAPAPAIPGHAGEPAYLISDGRGPAALLLVADAVFIPDPSTDVGAILDAAAIRAAEAVRNAP